MGYPVGLALTANNFEAKVLRHTRSYISNYACDFATVSHAHDDATVALALGQDALRKRRVALRKVHDLAAKVDLSGLNRVIWICNGKIVTRAVAPCCEK